MATRRFTILAVDDEPLNLQILSSVLAHEFEVVVAANAEDAMSRLRERKPDLILLDTMMPVVDGFDLCRVIKEERSFADIPVIFVSALDSEAAQLRAFELGCIDYITKPLNLRLLKLRLRNLITLKEQRDQLARHKDEQARMMAEMEAVNKRLQESEERWKFALEGPGDGLWDWDLASDTVYYSRQWKAMLGYGEDEIGNHLDEWRGRLHPEDRPAADADMQRHFRRETEVYGNEHRMLCKDGAYKWLLGRGKVITWNGDGTPRRVIGIHTDVTERKRAAIELAHSHGLMQYIIEHNSAPIAVLDRELRHIYVSQSFLDDYRVKERNIIGKLHYEVFPDIPEKWRDVHRRALAGEVLSSAEDPFPREDGSLDWARWECRPWHNADSSIGGIILYTEVITAQVAARKALRYQDEMRRTILDKIPAMVALFKDGNYEFASHCLETTLGWSLEEMQQHQDVLAEFYPDPASRQEVRDFLRECAGEWKDFKTRTRDGRILDTSWMTVALSDGSILGIGIDISTRKKIERDLVRAKEDWENTFEAVPDLIAIIDAGNTFRRVNRAMADRLGVEPQELIGKKCYEVMHGSSHPYPLCPHSEMLHDGGCHVEQVEEKQLGAVFEVTVAPITGPDGAVTSCVHVARDVTARKLLETYRSMGQDILHVLNEQEDRQQATERIVGIIKSATGVDAVAIRLQDGEDFPYLCQEGFSEEFVQKESSLLARTLEGGIRHDEYGNVCLEGACGVVLAGKTTSSSEQYTSRGSFWTNDSFCILDLPADQEIRLNPRNECIHQGFASVALVPIRAKGRIVGLLQLNDKRKGAFALGSIEALEGIAENIGEAMLRKQAEEKLLSSEQFFRKITDELPGMVGYWTNDLHCRLANKAYLEWFGKTPEQMLGISLQELLGDELFLLNKPYIDAVLEGKLQRFERKLVKQNGEPRFTWGHYIPDIVDNAVQGFFVLVSDVTELKLAEEEKLKLEDQLMQAQRIESIGRLAGGVAHDFNNYLTTVGLHSELGLLDLDPRHPTSLHLVAIAQAAKKSAALTQQLLGFARKQAIAPKVLNLNEKIENMLQVLKPLLGENIEICWRPSAGLWHVKVDPTQVDQIVSNLCINARDAIKHFGRIVIETSNTHLSTTFCAFNPGCTPGPYVVIAVKDTGCGMEKQIIDQIFDPFFTTKALGEGTGLGMATVYGIVKQNNGYITVESIPGHGTTVTIYLPQYEGDKNMQQSKPQKELPGGDETILVVEDDENISIVVKTLLEGQGYKVLTADGPGNALFIAQHAERIDLILTDVIMPEMNGRELAENLMSLWPEAKAIFMSGYDDSIIARHGVVDEGLNFMPKPFSVPDLIAKVREVLDSAGK